jgi:hypothetical protein
MGSRAQDVNPLGSVNSLRQGAVYNLEEVLGIFGSGSVISRLIVRDGRDRTGFVSKSIARMRNRINMQWSRIFGIVGQTDG